MRIGVGKSRQKNSDDSPRERKDAPSAARALFPVAMPEVVPPADLLALQRLIASRPANPIKEVAPPTELLNLQRLTASEAASPVDETEPLPGDLRDRFERSLGTDLRGVRIHRDTSAEAAANAFDARAFTIGKDIHFASGQYQPGTAEGARLLAHEVVHVAQQSGGPVSVQAKLAVSSPGDPAESEADALAASLVSGESVSVQSRPGPQIMRERRSTGLSLGKVKDVLVEANGWISIDTVAQQFKDFTQPVNVFMPLVHPNSTGNAAIQLDLNASIARDIFDTKLGLHTATFSLVADENGKLKDVIFGGVDRQAPPIADDVEVGFLGAVETTKSGYLLKVAVSLNTPTDPKETTKPGTESKTTINVEGKGGLSSLTDRLPDKIKKYLPLPSADVTAKGSEEISVKGETVKDTKANRTQSPPRTYLINLIVPSSAPPEKASPEKTPPSAPPAPAGPTSGVTVNNNINITTTPPAKGPSLSAPPPRPFFFDFDKDTADATPLIYWAQNEVPREVFNRILAGQGIVKLTGRASSKGSEKYNYDLAVRRATWAMEALRGPFNALQQADADRIFKVGGVGKTLSGESPADQRVDAEIILF